MEADGASFTPSLCQCSILRVFKAAATQIREKSEQRLESLRIELGNSSTEGSALTTDLCYTPTPKMPSLGKFLRRFLSKALTNIINRSNDLVTKYNSKEHKNYFYWLTELLTSHYEYSQIIISTPYCVDNWKEICGI